MSRSDDSQPPDRRALLAALAGASTAALAVSGCAAATTRPGRSLRTASTSPSLCDSVSDLRRPAVGAGVAPPARGGTFVVALRGPRATGSGAGGGGMFFWDPASTAPDDGGGTEGGTVINPDQRAGAGRWRRIYTGAVDIRWWGADENARPDVNARAIAAAVRSHPQVHVPAGTFDYDATITLAAGQTLTGLGPASVLRYRGSDAAIAVEPMARDRVAVRDLCVTIGEPRGQPADVAVRIEATWYVVLERVTIRSGFRVAGVHIHSTTRGNVANVRVSHCHIQDVHGDGILIETEPRCAGCYIISVTESEVRQNAHHGVHVRGANASIVYVVGNDLEGNRRGGIRAESLWASSVADNYFESPNHPGYTAPLLQLGVDRGEVHGQCAGLKVTGNTCSGHFAPVLMVLGGAAGSSGVRVENNWFNGNPGVQVSSAVVVRGMIDLTLANNHTAGPFTDRLVDFPAGPPASLVVQDRHGVEVRGGRIDRVRVVSDDTALGPNDHVLLVNAAVGRLATIQLPADQAAGRATGRQYVVKRTGAGGVVIDGAGAPIDGARQAALSTRHGAVSLIFDGQAWAIVAGSADLRRNG